MKKLLLGTLVLVSTLAQAENVRFLREDKDALQARVDIIQEAKKEIQVEYFSVWNDDQSLGGMALLLEAARRGVKVKVIIDALSHTIPKETFAALLALGNAKEKNMEIRLYNPLSINLLEATNRDHAKMLIADGKYLITGGRNVGDKYFGISKKRNFSDLDIMAKGNVAQVAKNNFMATWGSKIVQEVDLGRFSPDQLEKGACEREIDKEQVTCEIRRVEANELFQKQIKRILKIKDDMEVNNNGDLFISNSGNNWFRDSYEINKIKLMSHEPTELVNKKNAYLNADLLATIKAATKDVNIISPYLMPTDKLIEVFEELTKKGVRVRIITNSINSTDNLLAQGGYRRLKEKLIKIGIEIYEYNGPDTIHAKTGLVDNRVVLIGTYNIDPRSAFINREVGVIANDSEDTGLAKELEEIIEHFRNNSTLISQDGVELNKDDNKNANRKKKILLKMISPIIPLIESQL